MRIAFDAQLLMKSCPTGIGRYADNILKHMKATRHVFSLNIFAGRKENTLLSILDEYEQYGYKVKKSDLFSDAWYKLITALIPLPYSFFFGRKTDVTVFFNYIVPPGVKGKRIVYIHDMTYKVYPNTVRWRTKIWLGLNIKRTKKRADKIVTISEFSKQEIIKYLGIQPDKIEVVYAGVDRNIYHPNYSYQEIDSVKKKYCIAGEYFLYLGTLEPRKNIKGLLNAFLDVKLVLGDETPKLVLAGRKGWMYQEFYDFVTKHCLENDVCFTGYVTEKESAILMNGTRAFLFPSIYEGFGMPPLEAMACGAPVIASNVASIPEVVGSAGILVEPTSKEELCEAMIKIMQNKEISAELRENGIQRANKFGWEKSAQDLLNVIESIS